MVLLLTIYAPTLAAALLISCGLNLLGHHLAMQDRSVSCLCISQGAMLGVLLGIGFVQSFDTGNGLKSVIPFFGAALFATLTYLQSEILLRSRRASPSSQLVALFLLLLAAGSLLSSFFPLLEQHLAQGFFGDLATLSVDSAYFLSVYGIFLIGSLFVFHKPFMRSTIDKAIFGINLSRNRHFLFFNVLTLISISVAVHLVGLLFTLSCLLIPTAILSLSRIVGLKLQLVFSCAVAVLGTFFGFMLSLYFSWLPTGPAISFSMMSLALVISLGAITPFIVMGAVRKS